MIIKYIKSPYRISYVYNDIVRIYIPDILVIFKNNIKKLIEIKPKKLLQNKIVQLKAKYAKEYCKQYQMSYWFWTEKDLILV